MTFYHDMTARDAVIASLTSATTFDKPGACRDTPRHLHGRELSAAIKRMARNAFPGVAFRVNSSCGTATGYLRIRWVDGPRESDVGAVLACWVYERFDGSTDFTYSTNRTAFEVDGEWIEPSARGITPDRHLSPALVTSLVDTYCTRYPSAKRPTGDFDRGEWYGQFPGDAGDACWATIMHRMSTDAPSFDEEG